jgi:opacity protein-like surface antigen
MPRYEPAQDMSSQSATVWFHGLCGRARQLQRDVTHLGQQSTTNPPFPLPGGTCDPTLPTCVNFDVSNAAGQSNALMYGFSAGGGLDWALTQNIFVRGEFEFVQFAPITNISVAIISGRVGAGYKF